ncbi:MAG: glycosyltransferase [Candidatus Bathyarchaeia archaeon]
MTKIGFVLPVYREKPQNIERAILLIKKHFEDALIIVVADDVESGETAKKLDAVVPYHPKKLGFGKSLCEGLCLAWFTYDCDVVVTVDVDHPFEAAARFIEKLDKCDVIVGRELGGWKRSRVWSNQLVRKFLFNDVSNPTCGFTAWKSSVLRRLPWGKIKSTWDAVHIELLFWAKDLGAKICEEPFEEVKKERRYVFSRYVNWLFSFLRLLRLKYIYGYGKGKGG